MAFALSMTFFSSAVYADTYSPLEVSMAVAVLAAIMAAFDAGGSRWRRRRLFVLRVVLLVVSSLVVRLLRTLPKCPGWRSPSLL